MTTLPMTAFTALPWSGPASGEALCSTLLHFNRLLSHI